MNTTSKQTKPFDVDRTMPINVPVDYDDKEDKAITHKSLLPQPTEPSNLTIKRSKTTNCCRSVLGGSWQDPN